jgi:radical SAM protein with 4Fe4S-binding SPASM domain
MGINDLQVNFVCNVNEPRFSSKSELSKVKRFLETFGPMCSLSFNIYRLDFTMDFLQQYILTYGLCRHIRLGLAHPIPGKKNLYINPDKFVDVKEKLVKFFDSVSNYNIEPGFDCGFPLCMFSDSDLGKMFKLSSGRLSFQCGPAIDIGVDLSVWSCFPLSSFNKKSLFDFSNYQELLMFYATEMHKVRDKRNGLYLQCDTCQYNKSGLCSGGCLAHVLNNLNN